MQGGLGSSRGVPFPKENDMPRSLLEEFLEGEEYYKCPFLMSVYLYICPWSVTVM